MKTIKTILILLSVFFLIHCGAGGTETGTTDAEGIDTGTIGTKVKEIASTLVPEVTASSVEASLSKGGSFLIDGTSGEWDTYLEPGTSTVLTDIFGDPDVEPNVVTKIRVLLDQLEVTFDDLFGLDPAYSCTGGSALSEGDSIEIAFYGNISNGTAEDRFFDCQYEDSDNNETIIYGQDSDGIVRVVAMSDNTSMNTEETATRGNTIRLLIVTYATYAEQTTDGVTTGFLDLQYAQATLYSGVDGDFNTGDDVVFKSRSRITGEAVLDNTGNPTVGMGDFTVTKHDEGVNDDLSTFNITNKTTGRGSYDAGDFSLFNIDSDLSTLVDIPGIFCIQQPEDGSGVPQYAEADNCSALETSFAWGEETFPFDFSPSLEEVFEDKPFFEGNDMDLIANDGSNFEIPVF